ncbi:MAG TPA: hypothetical protein VJZ75_07515 [Candidatus Bathyarchaeia archaeon]|nr:hypothetical protein [Candidatus Bathyarchaeia archaeon]
MLKTKRPAAVTLLAFLEISLATLAILVVAAARFELIRHIRWSVESLTIILPILAGFELALAYGFWTGKGWAWTVGLLFAILGTAISIFALYVRPTPGEVIYLVIDLTVIYFLMQPRVHQYFKHNDATGK